MSKNIIDKAQIQQSLAKKLWQKVKDRFQKTSDLPMNLSLNISDKAIEAIQKDLTLLNVEVEEKQERVETPIKIATKEEVEIEITLEELQGALSLLEEQNKNLDNADDTIKELINALKKSEQHSQENPKHNAKSVEVVIEFIPLPNHNLKAPVHTAFQLNQTIYREVRPDDMNEKLRKEKEQRELAKKITHYPPSDRLH